MEDIEQASMPQKLKEELTQLQLCWKAALEDNKKHLLTCPNYQRKCNFKCGSVEGMQSHYLQCSGVVTRRSGRSKGGSSSRHADDSCVPCIEGVKGGAVDGGSRDDRTEVERKDKGKACEDDKIDGEKPSLGAVPTPSSTKDIVPVPASTKETVPVLSSTTLAKGSTPSDKKPPPPSPPPPPPPLVPSGPSKCTQSEAHYGNPLEAANSSGGLASQSATKGMRADISVSVPVGREQPETATVTSVSLSSLSSLSIHNKPPPVSSSSIGSGPKPLHNSTSNVPPPVPLTSAPPTKVTPWKDPNGKIANQAEKKMAYYRIPFKKGHPDGYEAFLPKWREELKANKFIRCPNFEILRCVVTCFTVNGMKYHYLRCGKESLPVFKCDLCPRSFGCRTGLIWHLKNSHKVIQEGREKDQVGRKGGAVRAIGEGLKCIQLGASPGIPPDPGGCANTEVKKADVSIPPSQYPDVYRSFIPLWREELKTNKIIRCPNRDPQHCKVTCSTVNGMKYHYMRCGKESLPEFKCDLCSRTFVCRSGLIWHLKNGHKLADLPTSKHVVKVTVSSEGVKVEAEELKKMKRKRKRKEKRQVGFVGKGRPPEGKRERATQELEEARSRVRPKQGGRRMDSEEGEQKGQLSTCGTIERGGLKQVALLRRRKRPRKSVLPRRTASVILRMMQVSSPVPKLAPVEKKIQIPPVEYDITDEVPTDLDDYGTGTIYLSEDTLVWRQPSESEEEWNGDSGSDGWSLRDDSSPSQSDDTFHSDEDYASPTKKNKGKGGKGRGKAVVQLPEFSSPPPLDRHQTPSSGATVLAPKPVRVAAKPSNQGLAHLDPKQIPAAKPAALIRPLPGQVSLVAGPAAPLCKKPTTASAKMPGPSSVLKGPLVAPPVLPAAPCTGMSAQSTSVVRTQGQRSAFVPAVSGPSTSSTVSQRGNKQAQSKQQQQQQQQQQKQQSQKQQTHKQQQQQKQQQQKQQQQQQLQQSMQEQLQCYQQQVQTALLQQQQQQQQQPDQAMMQCEYPTLALTAGSSGVTYFLDSYGGLTPVQLVQEVSGHLHSLSGYPMVSQIPGAGGGFYLVQGGTPEGGLSLGGQPVQLVAAEDSFVDNSQKMSVVMDPSGSTVFLGQPDMSGYTLHFTQLDGPPSPVRTGVGDKGKKKDDKGSLQKRFEAARREEAAKLADLCGGEGDSSRSAVGGGPSAAVKLGDGVVPLVPSAPAKRRGTGEPGPEGAVSSGIEHSLEKRGRKGIPSADRESKGTPSLAQRGRKRTHSSDIGDLFQPDVFPGGSGQKPTQSAPTVGGNRTSSARESSSSRKKDAGVLPSEEPLVSMTSREIDTQEGGGVSLQSSASGLGTNETIAGAREHLVAGNAVQDGEEVANCTLVESEEDPLPPQKRQKDSKITSLSVAVQSQPGPAGASGSVKCRGKREIAAQQKKGKKGSKVASASTDKPIGSRDAQAVPPPNPIAGSAHHPSETTAPTPIPASSPSLTSPMDSSVSADAVGGLTSSTDAGSLADQPTPEPGPSDARLVADSALCSVGTHVEGGDGPTKKKRGRPRKQGTGGQVSVVKCPKCEMSYWSKKGLDAHIAVAHPQHVVQSTAPTPIPASSPSLTSPMDSSMSADAVGGVASSTDAGSLADQPTPEPGPSDARLVADSALCSVGTHVEGGDGPTKKKRGRPRKQGTGGQVSVVKCPKCEMSYWSKKGLDAHIAVAHPQHVVQSTAPTPIPASSPSLTSPMDTSVSADAVGGVASSTDAGSLADQPTPEPGPSDARLVADSALCSVGTHVEGGDGPTKKKRGRPRKQGTGGQCPAQKAVPTLAPAASSSGHGEEEGGGGQEGQGEPLKCPKCEMSYMSKTGLSGHIAIAHPAELPPDAPLTDRVQQWRSILKRQKSVLCSTCGVYKATSIPSMKYHYERCGKKTKQEFNCPHCGRPYTTQPGLTYHINTRHARDVQGHTTEDSLEPRNIFTEPDINQVLPARVAAQKATSVIHRIVVEETPAELSRPPPPSSLPKAPSTACAGIQTERVAGPGVAPPIVGLVTPGAPQRARPKGDRSVRSMQPQLKCLANGELESKVIPGRTNNEVIEMRKQLLEQGYMNCIYEDCTKTFKSIPGLQYHINVHKLQKEKLVITCSLCDLHFDKRKKLQKHMWTCHEILQEDGMDGEYQPKLDGEEDSDEASDDWEAEKDQGEAEKDQGGSGEEEEGERRRKQGGGGRSASSRYNKEISMLHRRTLVKEMLARLHSPSGTLEELQPQLSHWSTAPDQSVLGSYLPCGASSITFSFSQGDPTKCTSQDHTLPLFGSVKTHSTRGAVLYAGGPVWSMDWAPVQDPKAEHFLSLAAYRELDDVFRMDTPLVHRGLIQVWNTGLLNTSPSPSLCLGILHEYGCIRAMRWCPSGAWQPHREDSELTGALPRLGLLALGSSDGYVRVMSIPHPSCLLSALYKAHLPTQPLVLPVGVSLTLVPSGFGVSDLTAFGQCLCVEWQPGNGHTKIAAGFSKGVVCVWSLRGPQLCKKQDGGLLHPLVQLVAHTSICRAVAWCPGDPNYIVTGGYDRTMKLWDLRQPFTPLDCQERGLSWELFWPLLWCGVVTCEDTISHKASVLCCSYNHVQPGSRGARQLSSPISSTSCGSYSSWTDRVAWGSCTGDLHVRKIQVAMFLATNRPKVKSVPTVLCRCSAEPLQATPLPPTQDGLSPSQDNHPPSQGGSIKWSSMREMADQHKVVFVDKPRNQKEDYSSKLVPFTAVNKICWNNSVQCYDWLAFGLNCGLVRLWHLPC